MNQLHPRHTLIFEPDPRGHAREWLHHLLSYISQEHDTRRVTLAVPAELADALLHTQYPHIDVQILSDHEQRQCQHRSLFIASMARWRAMRDHLMRSGADHGFFLSIDLLSWPLALGFRATRPLSGILFRPSTHYRAWQKGRSTSKEYIRDTRKRVLYSLMLRNPSLHAVLSLDPYFPESMGSPKIVGLGDPAFPLPQKLSSMSYGIPASRTAFSLFGELTERKGLLVLLDALERLDGNIASNIAVVIAGRIDPSLKSLVAERITSLTASRPELWFKIDDRFLTMEELADLVRRCDVILAPYQRFVGSSGVMLWAASAGKPIITQDYGLLGKLTTDYGLGWIVDTTNPTALAQSIADATQPGTASLCGFSGMKQFIASRTPQLFVETILNAIDSDHNPQPAAKMMLESHTGHASPRR